MFLVFLCYRLMLIFKSFVYKIILEMEGYRVLYKFMIEEVYFGLDLLFI